jgi:hypothetical protein
LAIHETSASAISLRADAQSITTVVCCPVVVIACCMT